MEEDMDRDMSGKFKNGNTGGPGRPRRVVESDYLAIRRFGHQPLELVLVK